MTTQSEMNGPLWIMIAGPYTSGASTEDDRASNLRELNRVGYEIFRRGHIPIIGVNLALPLIEFAGHDKFDKLMMPISLAAADRCDAAIRIGGHSVGADQEIDRIRSRGGRIFDSLDDIPRLPSA